MVGMKQKLQMTNSGPGDSAADQMVVICSEKQARVRKQIYCISSRFTVCTRFRFNVCVVLSP